MVKSSLLPRGFSAFMSSLLGLGEAHCFCGQTEGLQSSNLFRGLDVLGEQKSV